MVFQDDGVLPKTKTMARAQYNTVKPLPAADELSQPGSRKVVDHPNGSLFSANW